MGVTPALPTPTQGIPNPATPKPSGLPIGGGFSFGAPLPIELDLPGAPKRYYEFGPIRFKFILDGKYEFFKTSSHFDSTAKHADWLGEDSDLVQELAPPVGS